MSSKQRAEFRQRCGPESLVCVSCVQRAMKDLNGRFFGGRTVTAAYFDEARYANQEFAPQPGEVPGH